jgi:hypothetical protein
VRFGAGELLLEPPIRNDRNIPISTVVLRIWPLYSDVLANLLTPYAQLLSLDEALKVAENNTHNKGLHEFSPGEYVTLLRSTSNQSPLPDCALLAIFSGICRLRRSAILSRVAQQMTIGWSFLERVLQTPYTSQNAHHLRNHFHRENRKGAKEIRCIHAITALRMQPLSVTGPRKLLPSPCRNCHGGPILTMHIKLQREPRALQ